MFSMGHKTTLEVVLSSRIAVKWRLNCECRRRSHLPLLLRFVRPSLGVFASREHVCQKPQRTSKTCFSLSLWLQWGQHCLFCRGLYPRSIHDLHSLTGEGLVLRELDSLCCVYFFILFLDFLVKQANWGTVSQNTFINTGLFNFCHPHGPSKWSWQHQTYVNCFGTN